LGISFRPAVERIAGMHETVNHGAGEYARDGVYASTVDGFGYGFRTFPSATPVVA
jgi:hypothetical protein